MKSLLPPCLALPLALLGACQSRDAATLSAGPRFASLDAAFAPRTGAGIRRPDRGAVAVLPDWIGRPSRIEVLARPGGSAQAVTFAATRGTARLVAAWPEAEARSPDLPPKPTREGIRDELTAVLPGVAMEVVTRPSQNAYGPYGLALGRDGAGRRCLYAWQWIEAPPPLGFAEAGRPLSLRLRLCRADLTFDAMAAAFDRLRLVPAGSEAAPPRRRRPRAVAAGLVADAGPRSAPDAAGRRYLGIEAATARPPLAAVAATGPAPEPSGRIGLDLPPEALRGPSSDSTRPRD